MIALEDHTATDCKCEKESHHYRKDAAMGYGPVLSAEMVVLAVFEGDKHDAIAMRLKPAKFDSGQLKRFGVSLARTGFTTRPTFDEQVVRSKRLVGVAQAIAAQLRSVPYIDQLGRPPVTGRAVCLIDKVDCGDHDGHAAIGWSESWNALAEGQKKRAGEIAKSNIARAFGGIVPADQVAWMAAA